MKWLGYFALLSLGTIIGYVLCALMAMKSIAEAQEILSRLEDLEQEYDFDAQLSQLLDDEQS
jgi:hypothetical protein